MRKCPDWIEGLEQLILSTVLLFAYALLLIAALHFTPNAEDYEVSCGSRDIGILQSILACMVNYDGRYSTNFLHAINPLVFNWFLGYSFVTFFSVCLTHLCLTLFLHTFFEFRNLLWTFLWSGLFTIVWMDSIICYGTYYKMAGNFVYIYPVPFTTLFITLLYKYLTTSYKFVEDTYFVCTSFVLIIGIGFCELFLPFYFVLLGFLLLYFFSKDKSRLKKFLPVFLIGAFAILFFVITPGVSTRINEMSKPDDTALAQVVFNMVKNYGKAISSGVFTPAVLIATLCFYTLFATGKMKCKHAFTFIEAVVITLLLISVSVLMTTTYYLPNMDTVGYPDKLYTPILFIIFTGLLFVIGSLFKAQGVVSSNVYSYTRILMLLALCCSFTYGNNYLAHIYADWKSGNLKKFKDFMDNRVTKLESAYSTKIPYVFIQIPPLIEYPNTAYISTDSESMRHYSKWNKFHEEFFRINEVCSFTDSTMRFKSLNEL